MTAEPDSLFACFRSHGDIVCRLALVGLATVLALPGCGRDARLADHDVRELPVGTVRACGRTLDTSASPEEVVFVLLKAVVDDFDAGDDMEARERAFDTQLATCAPQEIKQTLARRRDYNPRELRELLYSTVRHWAPTLGFYRDDFRVEFATLKDRMYVIITPQQGDLPAHAQVYLNVAHPDPEQRPGADVVARFLLAEESGYWRIWWVGWETSTRNWKTVPPRGINVPRRDRGLRGGTRAPTTGG